jgi:hypothetical protein
MDALKLLPDCIVSFTGIANDTGIEERTNGLVLDMVAFATFASELLPSSAESELVTRMSYLEHGIGT